MRITLPSGAFLNPATDLPVIPGTILGYRRNGQPIRVAAGGSGEGGDGGGGSDGGAGDGGGGESGQGGEGQGDSTKPPNIDGEFDADRAKRAIAAARDAEKKARGDAKAAKDQVAAILAAAGLKPDGTKDPAEQLKEASAKATGAEAKARNAQIEAAVLRRAGKAGGDPDALLDSTSFMNSMKDIDPDAADFGDQVTAAIKAAVKSNGKLAATGQGPARQGADHTGGGTSKGRSGNLTDAVKRKLGG
ncbi:hypothetical protein C5N14_13660 [Micromonospora sp. MW-13]|uniref:hypothetical protein n=1 Tax=Micromonospora sp. MW-13 TaxID=2094022 RepID=UPI000EDC2886|nr:hypothetical protein [Micromonospora sp. MW-13]RGC68428.1 hypothetical protein C5N14_13660 [Micromonospora sp. MW-13]